MLKCSVESVLMQRICCIRNYLNEKGKSMDCKKLIAYINSENEWDVNVIKAAKKYSNEGADEFFVYNYTKDEASREEFFSVIEQIKKEIDIPFMAGLYVTSLDDVKKVFSTGAERIVIKEELIEGNKEVIDKAIKEFGRYQFLMEIDSKGDFANWEITAVLKEKGFSGVLIKHTDASERLAANIRKSHLPVIIRDSLVRNIIKDFMVYDNLEGVATNYYRDKDIMKAKISLKEDGIQVN